MQIGMEFIISPQATMQGLEKVMKVPSSNYGGEGTDVRNNPIFCTGSTRIIYQGAFFHWLRKAKIRYGNGRVQWVYPFTLLLKARRSVFFWRRITESWLNAKGALK